MAECQNKGWGLSANVCPPLQSTLGPIERSNPLEILNGKEEPGVELAEIEGDCLSWWKKLETTTFNNWVTTICSIGEEAEHFVCVKYNWSWMWPSWKDAMVERGQGLSVQPWSSQFECSTRSSQGESYTSSPQVGWWNWLGESQLHAERGVGDGWEGCFQAWDSRQGEVYCWNDFFLVSITSNTLHWCSQLAMVMTE